ncbi:MAG: hypothetical protein IPH31_10395 [Lewinellaceae bacterium]|nr:hypothetical protein [Lewinellaceae bacterium]
MFHLHGFTVGGHHLVDGNEGGERGEQTVLQAQLGHGFIALFIRAESAVIHEVFDAFAGPDGP